MTCTSLNVMLTLWQPQDIFCAEIPAQAADQAADQVGKPAVVAVVASSIVAIIFAVSTVVVVTAIPVIPWIDAQTMT